MKRIFAILGLLYTGLLANAQQKGTAVKDPNKYNVGVKAVAAEGYVSAVESNLASGKLSLVKIITKNASNALTTSYSLKLKDNNPEKEAKVSPVSLTREAFETYFQRSSTEVSQKWQEMLRYVQSEKLSLSDEAAWTKAVNHFNILF